MGNNSAFTAFEATVIAAYNKGALDKDLLGSFMAVYRGMDIDSGGMVGTLSNDGLDVVQISLKIFNGAVPVKPELPPDYKNWTPEQDQASQDYYENLWGAFCAITDQFGWC